MIWVCLYLFEQAGYSEVISAVPVQQLPHECAVSGFPLVLDDFVLGCDRTGVPNQFWDIVRNEVSMLPSSSWATGDDLFAIGRSGGLWDSTQADWHQPKRRVLDDVVEGSVQISDLHVLWVTRDSVHVLDLETGVSRQHPAEPVQGQAPVLFEDSLAWIEWGSQPSIQVWTVGNDATVTIPATLPTQLYSSKQGLYWIDTAGIQQWSFIDRKVRTVQSGLIQDLWVTNEHLCWTQVHPDDVDVWCDGTRWKRDGVQRSPRVQSWGRTFVENGQLMKVIE